MRAVSRKPMGRWKEFKRKCCQILLNLSELLRVEERQWEECFCEDFCVRLISAFLFQLSLSLPSCLSAYLCPICLSVCFRVGLSVCLFASLQPRPLTICFWICSHASDSPAHRWCWHLLWDPGRWQGAQSLPEGQGAAGDQAPQPHGEGESPGRDTMSAVQLLPTLRTTPPPKHACGWQLTIADQKLFNNIQLSLEIMQTKDGSTSKYR